MDTMVFAGLGGLNMNVADYILKTIEFAGMLISMFGVVVLLKREMNKSAVYLMLSNIACLLLNGSYFLILQANEYGEAMTTFKIQYFVLITFYFFYLMFCLTYLRVRMPKCVPYFWLFFDGIQVMILWMGRHANIIIENAEFIDKEGGSFQRIETTGGILYTVNYGAICIALGGLLIMCLCKLRLTKDKSEKTGLITLASTQAVVIISCIIMIKTSLNIDIVPISSTIVIFILSKSVVRGELFNVTNEGKTWAFENIDPAIIIVDSKYGFLEANKSARTMYPELEGWFKNIPLPEEIIYLFHASDETINIGEHYYDIVVSPLEQADETKGYCLVMTDVTKQQMLMEQVIVEKEKAEAANEAKSSFLSNMSHEIRTPMNAIVGMTEILMRSDLPDQEKGYLTNIKNSGNSLLSIINDILDFSKIESGKLEIIEENYQPMSMLSDMGMIFLTRIGEKPVDLIFDIDKNLPSELYGDALRIRQVIINLMNNAIKFTEQGNVKLTIEMRNVTETSFDMYCNVKDTGQGIKEEDMHKLFDSFSQVDTRKNRNKEGTGLGLAISKQLVELMGGTIGLDSVYGEGTEFFFTIPQRIVDNKRAADLSCEEGKPHDIASHGVVAICTENILLTEQIKKLCTDYEIECTSEITASSADEYEYVFCDVSDFESNKEVLQEIASLHNAKLVVMQNCMRDRVGDSDVKVVDKPLFSLNFCQLMNHEDTYGYSVEEEQLICFTASDARILIVDDNGMNLKVAKGILEPLRMQIDTAESGMEAIRKIKENEYNIVFMDHMMPVMDGVETTEKIRAMEGDYYKNLPIIALTANAVAGAREEFIAAGMDDFVAKPIDMKSICQVIREYLPRNMVVQADPSSQAGSNAEELRELPVIGDLDVEAGIKYSGGYELFMSLLGDFYKLIDMKSEKIEKCLADGMIRDYTIEVHALKNTSRMIGALELSDMFLDLEQKGNAEETEYLVEKTPEVLEKYSALKPILKPYDEASNGDKKDVPVEEIIETLNAIKNAMDSFDLDGADAALKNLEEMKLPDGMSDTMNKLRALVADVAMEDVISLADEMIEKLR